MSEAPSRSRGYEKDGKILYEDICKECGGVVKPTCKTYDQLICFKCNGLYKKSIYRFMLPKEFKSLRHILNLPLDKNYVSDYGETLRRRLIGQTAGVAMLMGDVANLARLDTGFSREKVFKNMLGEDGLALLEMIHPGATREMDVA